MDIDFSKMTPAQALEFAKKATAYAALADGKALNELCTKIQDMADDLQVSEKYIATLLAKKFGINIAEDGAKPRAAKKRAAIHVIREVLTAKGVAKFPNNAQGNEAATAKFIELEGQEAFDKVMADYPPTIKK